MTSLLLFDELLERLRREGFSVGTDQYLRMHDLFGRFADATPERLETLLCPILAMSAEEQCRFHTAYQEFFSVRPARAPRRPFSETMHMTLPGTVAKPKDRSIPRERLWLAAVLVVTTIIVLIAMIPAREVPAPPSTDVPSPATNTASEIVTPRVRKTAQEIVNTNRWLLACAAFAVLLSGAALTRALLRWMHRRRNRGKGRPFDWPLRDPHPTAPRLFADARFFRVARLMKGREVGDVRRLDVLRSVLATIRAVGEPVFEYVLDRRVSEYLVLVERLSERDHLAAYVEAMFQALARDGVLVEVFEHDGDPRHCWRPGTSGRIVTADLQVRFPQHRLIIVGSAAALTHPVTGQALDSIPRLFPWNWRAILTPEEESRAVRRFEEYFDVYGLAEDGLARLAERWQASDATRLPEQRRAGGRRRSVRHLPESPDELATMLGPLLFEWMLRCAVHPTLHWDLTRALAPPLPAAEHDAALLALARLEWFRQGRIPEPVRLALVARLADDETLETAARDTTMRVLAAAPPPPASSVAARVFEIQQLGHRIWLARDQPAEVRPLIRQLRRFAPPHVARDNALMMLLHDAPGTIVARAVPQPLRRLLFGEGVPAFGLHAFLPVMLAVPIVAFLGNALWNPDVYLKTVHARRSVQVVDEPVQVEVNLPPTTPIVATTSIEMTQPRIKTVLASPPALPTMLQPVGGSTVELATTPTMVEFAWEPAGTYTLQVKNSQGRTSVRTKVQGTSWQWRINEAGNDFSWMLTAPDGRATRPTRFKVQYLVPDFKPGEPMDVVRMQRTKTIQHPVSCKPTEGTYRADLELTPRETFESVEVEPDKRGLASAEVKIIQSGPIVVYHYSFVPAEPCESNRFATVNVRATLRLAAQ